MADDVSAAVNNILTQLKGVGGGTHPKKETVDEIPTAEELEQYIITRASELVNQSMDILDEFKDVLITTPSDESASAIAELINSTSSAIETLNKIHTANKRAETSLKIKKIEIDARKEMNREDNQTRLMMTRADIVKLLQEPEKATVVDVEATECLPDSH